VRKRIIAKDDSFSFDSWREREREREREKERERERERERELLLPQLFATMKVKMKIDIGLKMKKKKSMKKRILPMVKRGILSILPLLKVFGSLVSDAAVVAKAVNNNKAAQRQLEKRHNYVMESQSWSLSRSVLVWTKRHNGKIKKIKKKTLNYCQKYRRV